MTILRSARAIAAAASIALALYVLFTAVGNIIMGAQSARDDADVIVVMGAAQYDGVPSPLLEGRLRATLELWQEGRAPLIAVTGGKQEGDRFTEAATSRRWLTDRGVPAESILAEESGRSTFGSLELLAPVLRAAGAENIIVVTDGWHLPRSVLSARELGFQTQGAAVTPGRYAWSGTHSARELVGVAVGRIIGFSRLLDITG